MCANLKTAWAGTLVCLILLQPIAAVAEVTTWPFELSTSGENVYWVSPTAVDNTAPRYNLGYELTSIVVVVRYSIITIPVDVTTMVPPEYLTGEVTQDGPPPIVVFDGLIVFPEPPEPAGVSADIYIGLDADGYGVAAAESIVLGEIEVEIPGLGLQTVEVLSVQIHGTLSAEPVWYELGDLNCDGWVNNGDIDPFVFALSYPDQYPDVYPDCDIMNGDITGDGWMNNGDIDAFLELIVPT